MKFKRRILAVLLCLFLLSVLTVPAFAADNDDYAKNIANMDEFAYKVYKAIRSIVCPLAIISFASCGYKFLGSIFFGNYASMASNDMMKAQKQLVYTIMAVFFIIFLPKIFSFAIGVFQASAWKP